MNIDFEKLWDVIESHYSLGGHSIHGPRHWRRVEENGLHLASETEGADITVIRLFAVFHDSCRENEGHDPMHGQRGAALARNFHGSLFETNQDQLELLCLACSTHHQGAMSDDPTIGCCYDADRLDLIRVRIEPDPQFMNTKRGREMAAKGIQL